MSNKSKLNQWLELLQQESWQLELIISGFAIFLVASLFDPLMDIVISINVSGTGLMTVGFLNAPFMVIYGTWIFLLVTTKKL